MVCWRVLISGGVQGVGFRFHTQEQATRLKLKGFVRNLDDGRVEIVAAGDLGNLEELVTWAKMGPTAAKVKKVEVSEMKEGIPDEPFHIRRDGGKF
jgi:acylphosphatase